MESETTLVRAKSGVELHAISLVDLDFALVVLPSNAELDDSLWNGGNRQGCLVLWVLLEEAGRFKRGDELWESYKLA